MMKNKNVAFVLFVVLFIACWNLLDFIWSALITKSPYIFSAGTDLGIPLVAALIIGYFLFLRNKAE